jgi:hypothetical protein
MHVFRFYLFLLLLLLDERQIPAINHTHTGRGRSEPERRSKKLLAEKF